jgi:hypothetical protein
VLGLAAALLAAFNLPDTRAESAPDDILASSPRPLPVVLAARSTMDRRSTPRLALFFSVSAGRLMSALDDQTVLFLGVTRAEIRMAA